MRHNFRSPGADLLLDALRPVRDIAEDDVRIRLVGSMTPAEQAGSVVELADSVSLSKYGHNVTPSMLRMMAEHAEAMAMEYRRVAADRERTSS
jgi:hypothetical protein